MGNNGTADGQTGTNGGDPVVDVIFTAFPISNLDLTTQAAWDGLKTLSVPATACGADDNTPSLTLPGGAAATFDVGVTPIWPFFYRNRKKTRLSPRSKVVYTIIP